MVEKTERKVWYVDTGSMTKEEAEASLKRFMAEKKTEWEKIRDDLKKGMDLGKEGL